MPEPEDYRSLLNDPTVDIFDTETPRGMACAIFHKDLDIPGVRWVGSPFAIDYLRQIIEQARGHHGIGFTEASLTPDDYVGFCQPKGSGVRIDVPYYLRDDWNPPVTEIEV